MAKPEMGIPNRVSAVCRRPSDKLTVLDERLVRKCAHGNFATICIFCLRVGVPGIQLKCGRKRLGIQVK
jgi:hypothetical protein